MIPYFGEFAAFWEQILSGMAETPFFLLRRCQFVWVRPDLFGPAEYVQIASNGGVRWKAESRKWDRIQLAVTQRSNIDVRSALRKRIQGIKLQSVKFLACPARNRRIAPSLSTTCASANLARPSDPAEKPSLLLGSRTSFHSVLRHSPKSWPHRAEQL